MKSSITLRALIFCTLFLSTSLLTSSYAQAANQVRAVFYTSHTCPFCVRVTEEFLKPFEDQMGENFDLLYLNTTRPRESQMLQDFWSEFQIEQGRRGVPTIVIGDTVLVGAQEIPTQLPGLVRDALEAGSLDWPNVPGLDQYLLDRTPEHLAAGKSLVEKIQSDVPGNYISIFLLLLMIGVLIALLPKKAWQKQANETSFSLKFAVAIIGLFVALYLTYGESTQQELMCGPIGQCNIVQQSSLAMLFGFFPLGLLGAITYLGIIILYFLLRKASQSYGAKSRQKVENLGTIVALLSGGGFLFSIFLTFWQPFMIGATCMWCLLSAVTMTLTFIFNRDYLKV